MQGQVNNLRLQVQMQLAGLLTARKRLNEELQDCMPLFIGLRHMARQHLRVCSLIDAYRTSLRDEHLLMLDYVSTMYKHVRPCAPVLAAGLTDGPVDSFSGHSPPALVIASCGLSQCLAAPGLIVGTRPDMLHGGSPPWLDS